MIAEKALAQIRFPDLTPLPGDAFAQTGIQGLFIFIVNGLFLIAGALAVIYFIFAGFQYLTSAGNPEAAQKARNSLLYAVVGIVVIALSYAILNAVQDVLRRSGGTAAPPGQQQQNQGPLEVDPGQRQNIPRIQ